MVDNENLQEYNNLEIQEVIMKKVFSTQNIVLMALFVALIAVCSWISLPIGPVPFTLQTFAVFVVAGLLGLKRGLITVLVYILLGAAGAPVFSNFKGGVGVIVGPTGGYILGFLLTVIVIGLAMYLFRNQSNIVRMIAMFFAAIVGDAFCFAVGTYQFVAVSGNTVATSLAYCVLPYIIPDLIKIVIAVIVVNRVKKYVTIFND